MGKMKTTTLRNFILMLDENSETFASLPECFDAKNDGEGFIVQKFTSHLHLIHQKALENIRVALFESVRTYEATLIQDVYNYAWSVIYPYQFRKDYDQKRENEYRVEATDTFSETIQLCFENVEDGNSWYKVAQVAIRRELDKFFFDIR